MTTLKLLKISPLKHTPEYFGLKLGDTFSYVNKASQVCIGMINSKYNVQTQKNELYFDHINMQYFITDLKFKIIYDF